MKHIRTLGAVAIRRTIELVAAATKVRKRV